MALSRGWQFSYGRSLSGHSWRNKSERSVSAMFILIALLALGVWALVATVIELRRDGYRRVPTDWSRVAEQDSLDRAGAGHVYR